MRLARNVTFVLLGIVVAVVTGARPVQAFDPPEYCFHVPVNGHAFRFAGPPNAGPTGAQDHCAENSCEQACWDSATELSECELVDRYLEDYPSDCAEGDETMTGPPLWTYESVGTCTCTCEGGSCIGG